MSRPSFSALIHSQPWQSVAIEYDAWYQYAVCTKISDNEREHENTIQQPDWTTV
jgi:hypothetical protein